MINHELKILIVEDNLSVALDYEMILKGIDIQDIKIVDSAEKALKLYSTFTPDIAIVDIELNGSLSGIEFAKFILKEGLLIIFATASRDNVVYDQVQSVQPFAYLVKPINKKSLESIILSAAKSLHNEKDTSDWWYSSGDIFITVNNKLIKVSLGELIAIEVKGDFCSLITESKQLAINAPLYKIHEKLDPNIFIQIHRRCIVNALKIDRVLLSDNEIGIKNKRFTISNNYKMHLIKKLNLI